MPGRLRAGLAVDLVWVLLISPPANCYQLLLSVVQPHSDRCSRQRSAATTARQRERERQRPAYVTALPQAAALAAGVSVAVAQAGHHLAQGVQEVPGLRQAAAGGVVELAAQLMAAAVELVQMAAVERLRAVAVAAGQPVTAGAVSLILAALAALVE